jgi:hypothetical protein
MAPFCQPPIPTISSAAQLDGQLGGVDQVSSDMVAARNSLEIRLPPRAIERQHLPTHPGELGGRSGQIVALELRIAGNRPDDKGLPR